MELLQYLSDDEIEVELDLADQDSEESLDLVDQHKEIKLWDDKKTNRQLLTGSNLAENGDQPWKNRHLRKLVRVSPNAEPMPNIKKVEDPHQKQSLADKINDLNRGISHDGKSHYTKKN